MKKGMRCLVAVLLILLAAFLVLGGCSASYRGGEKNNGQDSLTEETDGENNKTGGRKILKSYKDIITTKDFKKTLEKLQAALAVCDGYVETCDINNDAASPSAVFVYRIPSEKAGRFKTLVSGSGDLAKQSENTEDVTAAYIDTEARLKVLTESRNAITAMLGSAKSVAELLELRKRLDELNLEIEGLTISLHKWDGLIEMSRYTVWVDAVGQSAIISETPYITQLSDALAGGFKGFVFIVSRIFLAVIYLLPYLLTAGAVLAVVLLIMRRRNRPRE